jgi:hypothetical protein
MGVVTGIGGAATEVVPGELEDGALVCVGAAAGVTLGAPWPVTAGVPDDGASTPSLGLLAPGSG